MAQEAWQVIIEWNGSDKDENEPSRKPPTKWYRYLHKLTGMSVRKQLGKTAAVAFAKSIQDRTQGDIGVIFQEGCVQVNSYSLARTIYLFAVDGIEIEGDAPGTTERVVPDAVTLVRIEKQEVYGTIEDRLAMERLKAAYSHRGRRKGKPMMWAVGCYECLATYGQEAYEIANCPVCGGTHVSPRIGDPLRFRDPGGDVFEAWKRTRFATGRFEVPTELPAVKKMDPGEQPHTFPLSDAPATVTITHDEERAFVEAMASSPLRQQIAGLDRETQLTVLDATLVARLRWRDERRGIARAEAVVEFLFLSDGAVDMISLTEHPARFDLIDAAGPIPPKQVAHYLFDHMQRRNQEPAALPVNGFHNHEKVPA